MKGLPLNLLGASLLASPLRAGDIEINIPNAEPGGQIRAALFLGSEAYEVREHHSGVVGTPKNGEARLVFTGIGNGTYGIAVFHDLNGNEKLDKNLFGLPTEPYGFSRNPEIGMKAPDFDDFAFRHKGQNQMIVIRLNGN